MAMFNIDLASDEGELPDEISFCKSYKLSKSIAFSCAFQIDIFANKKRNRLERLIVVLLFLVLDI